jgi:hypothetical protein
MSVSGKGDFYRALINITRSVQQNGVGGQVSCIQEKDTKWPPVAGRPFLFQFSLSAEQIEDSSNDGAYGTYGSENVSEEKVTDAVGQQEDDQENG